MITVSYSNEYGYKFVGAPHDDVARGPGFLLLLRLLRLRREPLDELREPDQRHLDRLLMAVHPTAIEQRPRSALMEEALRLSTFELGVKTGDVEAASQNHRIPPLVLRHDDSES